MGRLRGIVDSKRRYATYLRNQERTAQPADGRLDPRQHMPSTGPDGTLVCSCGGAQYSPTAYAKHLAGEPMRDSFSGTYTVGPQDAWAIERERKERADVPPRAVEQAEEVFRDESGCLWRPFVNQYRQRKLACVAGPRAGEETDDWRFFTIRPPEDPRRPVGGYDDSEFFR